jgi:hypothetical protein
MYMYKMGMHTFYISTLYLVKKLFFYVLLPKPLLARPTGSKWLVC